MREHTLDQPELPGFTIPQLAVRAQCVLFGVLWVITMLPNVLIVQNITLILGAIIGLFIAAKYYKSLLTKRAISLVMVALLFIWVTVHLFSLGRITICSGQSSAVLGSLRC